MKAPEVIAEIMLVSFLWLRTACSQPLGVLNMMTIPRNQATTGHAEAKEDSKAADPNFRFSKGKWSPGNVRHHVEVGPVML